jgi:hypothetical protein
MEPIHEGDNGMQSMLYDIFPVHDIRVDEGMSQLGMEFDRCASGSVATSLSVPQVSCNAPQMLT